MLSFIIAKIENQKIRLKEWYDAYLFRKYRKKALVPFDENWFRGKRVAIIGGADSAYKEKLGGYIDSYDVVVRINNGVRVIDKYKEYIGKRTDFLFHTFYENIEGGGSPIELDLWNNMEVRQVVFSHSLNSSYGHNLRNFVTFNKGQFSVIHLGDTMCQANIRCVFPYYPTTGLIAIHSILMCEPLEVYVTGITFFRTAHHQSYRSGSLDHWTKLMNSSDSKHNPEVEYQAFKKLYYANPTVFTLDSTLKEIIDNDK